MMPDAFCFMESRQRLFLESRKDFAQNLQHSAQSVTQWSSLRIRSECRWPFAMESWEDSLHSSALFWLPVSWLGVLVKKNGPAQFRLFLIPWTLADRVFFFCIWKPGSRPRPVEKVLHHTYFHIFPMNQLSMSSHVDTPRGQQGVTGSYWSMAHCQWCSQKMPMFAQTDRCWVESTPAWITPTGMMEGAAMVGPCAILALAWRVTRLTPQGFTFGVSDAAKELHYLGWEIRCTTMGFQRDQKWWVDIQKPSKTIDFIV